MAPRSLRLLPAFIPLVASASAGAEPAQPTAVSEVTRRAAFSEARTDGPLRSPLAEASVGVEARPVPSPVLDWVSPLFVWLEPGYGFAELTLAL